MISLAILIGGDRLALLDFLANILECDVIKFALVGFQPVKNL